MKKKKDAHLKTMVRAKVSSAQINDIVLPEPERLSRADAMAIANWASVNGVPAEDDPSLPARIKDMYGYRAATLLPLLHKQLAQRIAPHVAIANKHALTVELSHDEEGQYFHVTRERAKAPNLNISHTSAMMLLDAMGVLGPRPNDEREIEYIKNRLSRSHAPCIDICMGHYYDRLVVVVEYAHDNKATMIEWRTYDPVETSDPFEDPVAQ